MHCNKPQSHCIPASLTLIELRQIKKKKIQSKNFKHKYQKLSDRKDNKSQKSQSFCIVGLIIKDLIYNLQHKAIKI